jgi:hypothetical protein
VFGQVTDERAVNDHGAPRESVQRRRVAGRDDVRIQQHRGLAQVVARTRVLHVAVDHQAVGGLRLAGHRREAVAQPRGLLIKAVGDRQRLHVKRIDDLEHRRVAFASRRSTRARQVRRAGSTPTNTSTTWPSAQERTTCSAVPMRPGATR